MIILGITAKKIITHYYNILSFIRKYKFSYVPHKELFCILQKDIPSIPVRFVSC